MAGGTEIMPPDLASRLDWDDYRHFIAVARAGSVRRAAATLHTTAQTVSRRIASIEHALGVQLFKRQAQGVELTSDGQRILALVNVAEAYLLRAARTTREAIANVEGECRIALADGLGTYWLPRFLGSFAARHPGVALRVFSSTDRTLAKSPSHDIQIQYSDAPDESLVALRAATLHLGLFASAEYLGTHGTPAEAKELASHRLVDLTLVDSTKGTFTALSGFSSATTMMINSNGCHCESIRWGAGIGLLPTYASLLYDNLVPILPSLHYGFPIFLCYERAAGKQPAVRAVLDFLRDEVFDHGQMPWFAEEYVAPDPQWGTILRACVQPPARYEARRMAG